ncbi:MAG: hypothetical protein EPN70_20385 [Paraburkholderia sp.]|uniref:hypothetical protein n=1 Tax=Paraburkholderia sp. TaxID=1926495 RepID=UPI00120C9981|nr:hypothetical protein [Paraburkholderia sp.]TAM01106.1 MAG: hypothetical protein EPN70_20385 [Paraburkholderia sp.]TAM30380.1 MAG: hypothetical protein EPN59_09475 [Paraburkholderia sp.]
MNQFKFVTAAIVGIGIILLSGCSDDKPHFSVVTNPRPPSINITVTSDRETINEVIVNRGNCEITPYVGVKEPLKFGQRAIILTGMCNVMEVEVKADSGDYTYTFSQN